MFAVVGLVVGCSSTPEEKAPTTEIKPDTGAVKQVQPTKPSTEPSGTGTKTQQVGGDPLNDPSNILSRRSIFFDYDQFTVKDEFKPVVAAHAQYLQKNRNQRMTIQGNTDERGSREYNLALGQKRADAVKQMMTLSGAQSAQIETVSFGEEKPRAQGQTEQAFAENRRADLVYDGR
jgi:peptidoglycan-associated lipoprotein